jgi:hypothetical protein
MLVKGTLIEELAQLFDAAKGSGSQSFLLISSSPLVLQLVLVD